MEIVDVTLLCPKCHSEMGLDIINNDLFVQCENRQCSFREQTTQEKLWSLAMGGLARQKDAEKN